MATGSLKSWNAERGFGFLVEENGGPNIFLHIKVLKAAGIDDPDYLGRRGPFDLRSRKRSRRKDQGQQCTAVGLKAKGK
jgi:cold shock protein